MNKQIRTSPKSLNEWTLEQNITTELCQFFNSNFRFEYPIQFLNIFDIPYISFKNILSKNSCKTYKLTPIEENLGGGWDTKFEIPITKKEKRALFIQFKAGKHSEGNNIHGSIFDISTKNPNIHVEFKFNDNIGNNQHQTLIDLNKEIESKLGSPKSVFYAFPRITTIEQFSNLTDKLIFHTTFLTINEIEEEAKANSIQLNNFQTHYFRTCYKNENKREIASEIFKLKNNDTNRNLLTELIMLKMARDYNQIIINFSPRYAKNYLYLYLAEYFNILPSKLTEYEFFTPEINTGIKNYLQNLTNKLSEDMNNIFKDDEYSNLTIELRDSIFSEVFNFFENKENTINIEQEIPSNHTIPISSENRFEFSVNSNGTPVLIIV
ncbi:hypothetical protein EHQ42_04635 [Leptospira levettii]|uniref:hypothetical protein n=1 Tax=Leptospira levettii TaxID=2023178 RepID=UPI001082F5BB|nr:hypothetical protein [Leptospira levettii]TGL22051.1 hypothetical protein EHQ42_04635 [Leptospira levettii]